jgi:hypothetical protein
MPYSIYPFITVYLAIGLGLALMAEKAIPLVHEEYNEEPEIVKLIVLAIIALTWFPAGMASCFYNKGDRK